MCQCRNYWSLTSFFLPSLYFNWPYHWNCVWQMDSEWYPSPSRLPSALHPLSMEQTGSKLPGVGSHCYWLCGVCVVLTDISRLVPCPCLYHWPTRSDSVAMVKSGPNHFTSQIPQVLLGIFTKIEWFFSQRERNLNALCHIFLIFLIATSRQQQKSRVELALYWFCETPLVPCTLKGCAYFFPRVT